jgi:hypothetical protein
MRVSATDSYISHLENELRLPSWDLAVALTSVFGFSESEREEFLADIDNARLERARKRPRRRLEAEDPKLPADGEPLDAERIAMDFQAHPGLAAAYRDLVTAFSVPGYREAVTKTLRGLARTAASESTPLHTSPRTSDGA